MRFLTRTAVVFGAALLLSYSVQCQEQDSECWDDDEMTGDNMLGGLGPVGSVLGPLMSGGGLEIFQAAIKCAAEYATNADLCTANSTVDPFTVAKKCAEDTGFADLADQIQSMWPKKEAPMYFPAYKEHARCFTPDPSLFLQGAQEVAKSIAGGATSLAGGGLPVGGR